MTSPLRRLLLTFVILRCRFASRIFLSGCLAAFHSSFGLLHAAPPPELTVLRTQYDKVVAERVTAPFDASVAELNARFTAALQNAATGAKQAGKLEEVLAIQDDQKRLAEKLPIPDDTDATPESVKKLRIIYRAQLSKLEEARTASHQTILPAYNAKLQALEITLTKADRIDEATEIKTYREGLVAGAVPAASAPVAATTPSPSPEPETAASSKRTLPVVPREKEREVAIAAFKLDGVVSIRAIHQGKEIRITKPEDVPDGEMEIKVLSISQTKLPIKRHGEITPIAGLQHLQELNLDNYAIDDEDMEVIGTFPALERLFFPFARTRAGSFTGSKLYLLAAPEKLTLVSFGFTPVNSAGAKALGRCVNLEALNLARSKLEDGDLSHLASLTKLKTLDLRWTNTTIKGMRHLKDIQGLKSLGWSPDPKAPQGGFAELAVQFPQLEGIRLSYRDGVKPENYEGIKALPLLRNIFIEGTYDAKKALPGVATLPQIESLRGYWWDGVEDADLLPLQTANSLTSVEIDSAHKLTGKGLMHLTKMPKLKKLALFRFKLVKDADIDEFKRARPDVEITFRR